MWRAVADQLRLPYRWSRGLVLIGLAAAAAGWPLDAGAQQPPPGLTLAPSRVEATAAPGIAVGPFGLRNDSDIGYRIRVYPVLIGQDRSGGITVKDDARSLRQARRYLHFDTSRFSLVPGEADSAGGVLREVPAQGGFFGGLLFEGRPQDRSDEQLVEILRLNATLLLNPPADQQRIALGANAVRAEQPNGKAISLLLATENKGNTYLPATGSVEVVDDTGKVRAQVVLEGVGLLPGTTVDLSGRLGRELEAGIYKLRGTARMGGKTATVLGQMEISASGDLVFRDAELSELPTPSPEEGDPAEIAGTFMNTGNISFAPEAVAIVSAAGGGGEPAGEPQTLSATEAAPDQQGEITGSVELPEGSDNYAITVRLLDRGRILDARTITVTPQPKAGLLTRIGDWIRANAVFLVVVLFVVILALITLFEAWRRGYY